MENDNEKMKFEMRIPEEYNRIQHKHLGPILAVLVIILLVIFGGLYLWGGMLAKTEPTLPPIVNNEPETPRAVADAQILETLSPSDELDAIDADLGSTNLDTIDADLTTIDAELSAGLR